MTEYEHVSGEDEDSTIVTMPMRRGFRIYETNPSLSNRIPTRTKHKIQSKLGGAIVVAKETGVMVAKGAIGFIEETEVDTEAFVKFYLAGIRKYGELSKAGALMFEFIYKEMSGFAAKDKDMVAINYFYANQWKPSMAQRTYHRGLNELLTKEFLFRSPTTDLFFVNVRYMFNGDRISLVHNYRRSKNNNKRFLSNTNADE